MVNVARSCSLWVGSRLDSVLLGRKAKRVPSHGMQDIEAFHTLESRQNVGRRVPKGVPNMQPSPTGVGEHVEDVALGPGGVEAVADVRGAERAALLPVRLPPRLDLVVRVRPPRLDRKSTRLNSSHAD